MFSTCANGVGAEDEGLWAARLQHAWGLGTGFLFTSKRRPEKTLQTLSRRLQPARGCIGVSPVSTREPTVSFS